MGRGNISTSGAAPGPRTGGTGGRSYLICFPMEFHAVILCGPGRQLAPFSAARATGIPKPLLPVANRPLVEHVLQWCERAFFSQVTLVCDEAAAGDVQQAVDQYRGRAAPHRCRVAVEPVDTHSSGHALQHLRRMGVSEDFVVLPCDFITSLPPQVLIEAYRARRDSDVGMLVAYHNTLDVEDRKHRLFARNYTVYAESRAGPAQLLDYYAARDVDFHNGLPLRTQMLWQHPNATVSCKALDAAVFFGHARRIFAVFDAHPDKFADLYFASRPLVKVVRDLARMAWQSPAHAASVALMLVPHQAQFVRCNNLPVYMEANRAALKVHARDAARAPRDPAAPKPAATVGADCIIGDACHLAEKATVKRSVVGAHCSIGRRAKLTGCILLDNVVVEDDVQLENTIVGRGAVVRAKSKLTACYVESTHDVPKATHAKGDTLLCLSLEGLVDGDDDSEPSSDSSGSDDFDLFDDGDYDNSDGLFGY